MTNGINTWSHTINQNQLKMDQRFGCKTWDHKYVEENKDKPVHYRSFSAAFRDLPFIPKSKENKREYKQLGPHQTKSFCKLKETITKTKRHPTENIYTPCNWQRIDIKNIQRTLKTLQKQTIQSKNKPAQTPLKKWHSNGQQVQEKCSPPFIK